MFKWRLFLHIRQGKYVTIHNWCLITVNRSQNLNTCRCTMYTCWSCLCGLFNKQYSLVQYITWCTHIFLFLSQWKVRLSRKETPSQHYDYEPCHETINCDTVLWGRLLFSMSDPVTKWYVMIYTDKVHTGCLGEKWPEIMKGGFI